VETWGSVASKGMDAVKQVSIGHTPAAICLLPSPRSAFTHNCCNRAHQVAEWCSCQCAVGSCTLKELLLLRRLLLLLLLQELGEMIADECTFKADGVLYTKDLKGEPACCYAECI